MTLALMAVTGADAAERRPQFRIPRGTPLDEALTAFSEQADRDIIFQTSTVAGFRTAGISGPRTPAAALDALLAGTGLTWREAHGRLLIERAAAAPDTAPQPEPSAALEPLVVTATRRATLDQLTPMSVRAISRDEIARAGAVTFDDAAALLPGLNHTAVGVGRSRISVRGVHASGEATTAIYYDDVPVTGPSGTTADPGGGAPELLLVDVDRIELLRGPQGTLYGASAMGGALKLVFHRPDPNQAELQASAGVETAGEDVGGLATVVLNAPLAGDTASAIRFVAYSQVEPGYIDNRQLGLADVNTHRVRGARLAFAAEPAARLRVSVASAIQVGDLDDTNGGTKDAPPLVSFSPVRTAFESRLVLHQGQVRIRLPGAELTANAAAYSWRTTRESDYTGVLAAERLNPAGCARYLGASGRACDPDQLAAYAAYVDSRAPGLLHQPDEMEAQVQEVRLQSDTDGFVAWTLGVFRERRADTMDSRVVVADPSTGRLRADLGDTGRRLVTNHLKQQAVYGEATLGADRASSLTLGARRFDYDRRTIGRVLTPNVISNTVDANFETDVQEGGWSLKVLASHRFGASSLAYLQASQGFRPGGINTVPALPTALAAFEADSLWSYEAGFKTSLSDRATFNAALYRVDWRNMQFSAMSANGAFGFITNVGRARIDGLEVDAALVFGASRAGLNLNVNRAELVEDQATAAAVGLGSAGERLPFVAPVAFNLWGEHRPVAFSDVDLLLRADVGYLGRSHSTFNPSSRNDTTLGDVWLVNLRASAGLKPWRFSAYVDNLLDSHKPTAASTGSAPQAYPASPRRIGIAAAYNF